MSKPCGQMYDKIPGKKEILSMIRMPLRENLNKVGGLSFDINYL